MKIWQYSLLMYNATMYIFSEHMWISLFLALSLSVFNNFIGQKKEKFVKYLWPAGTHISFSDVIFKTLFDKYITGWRSKLVRLRAYCSHFQSTLDGPKWKRMFHDACYKIIHCCTAAVSVKKTSAALKPETLFPAP